MAKSQRANRQCLIYFLGSSRGIMDAVVELSRPGDGPGEGFDFNAADVTVRAVASVFQVSCCLLVQSLIV